MGGSVDATTPRGQLRRSRVGTFVGHWWGLSHMATHTVVLDEIFQNQIPSSSKAESRRGNRGAQIRGARASGRIAIWPW